MKILVLDNYDSFTYNLVHSIEKNLSQKDELDVFRNDKISIADVDYYDKIILSPGPGIPKDAGVMMKLIEKYHASKDIFGVCLGHQAISEFFGANLINTSEVFHGVATDISILDDNILFENINNKIKVGRYHSWIVSSDNLPKSLNITSVDDKKTIMSIKHNEYNVRGVQFHPESILTPDGDKIIENWVKN